MIGGEICLFLSFKDSLIKKKSACIGCLVLEMQNLLMQNC
jgi:hypothetical protein